MQVELKNNQIYNNKNRKIRKINTEIKIEKQQQQKEEQLESKQKIVKNKVLVVDVNVAFIKPRHEKYSKEKK